MGGGVIELCEKRIGEFRGRDQRDKRIGKFRGRGQESGLLEWPFLLGM